MKKTLKMLLIFALVLGMLLGLTSPALARRADDAAGYEDGEECVYCGAWRYDDWLCSGGPHCAMGYGCGDEHHCTECGACESWGDFCEECVMCLDCAMDTHQHCPGCGACGQEVGGCLICGYCFDCSPQCGAGCEDMCLDCHIEEGLACCECGNCYVDGSVDHCPECMLCSDCMYEDYCSDCGMCGYCACYVKNSHCPDCYACTKEEGCLLCYRCFNCGGRCSDGCGEMCLECHLGEDAACPDCGNCYVNDKHKRCDNCGCCEECGDGFCENCGMCMSCCMDSALHCPLCQICYEDAIDYCQSCGCCSGCALVCPSCRESCSECGALYCGECGNCSNCKDICELCELCEECTELCAYCRVRCANCVELCENCQTCAECAELCPACGQACSACSVLCPWCELCEDCCGEISRDAGCDHGICVMDPDFEEHWAAEHSGKLMVKLSVNKSSAYVDEPITWTATAVGATGAVQYCFDVGWEDYEAHEGDFVYEGSWTTRPTLTYTPEVPGEYLLWLSAKDAAGKTADVQGARVVVRYAQDSLRVVSVTADRPNNVMGRPITWTAEIQGGVGAKQYSFDIYRDGSIISTTAWSASNQTTWTTTKGGVYKVKVHVRDEAGKEVAKLGDSVPVLEVLSVVPEKTSAEVGEFVPWTVTMVGETTARRIQYDLYRDGVLVQEGYYVATPTWGYVLDEPGVYTVQVEVSDNGVHFGMKGEAVNVGLPLPQLRGMVLDGKNVLRWTEIPGASLYFVYRREFNGSDWGTWALKSKASETSWTDEAAVKGGVYEYRVRAHVNSVLGGYSNTVVMPLANPFEDVKEGKYYYDAVLWAYETDITSGKDETHFAPNETCTRGQVVTFLWNAMGQPEPTITETPFQDVKPGKFYYQAMLWAVGTGVSSGLDETHFGPNEGCTRGQVVTFLWNAAGNPEPTITEHSFEDVKPGKYYYQAMLWALETGVTSGKDETHFAPNETCTRGQVVSFLFRYMEG
ncbi:MAG: S-layer homology domain-containing protein [Oscillospiraceae bacterium]|nr:S-layer homology domain-containing protein [Oscillospiraceae bacterium]